MQKRKLALDTRRILVEKFPQVFKPFQEPKLPLKINIRRDLLQSPLLEGIDKYAIGCALRDYCRDPTYHSQMAPGATRIDLEGKPAGEVNEAAAQYHAREWARITNARLKRAREREDREAERKAKREPTVIVLDDPNYQGPTSLMFVNPAANAFATPAAQAESK